MMSCLDRLLHLWPSRGWGCPREARVGLSHSTGAAPVGGQKGEATGKHLIPLSHKLYHVYKR